MGGQRLHADVRGLLLLGGRIADFSGASGRLIGAITFFTLASLAGGLARRHQLVVARGIQGLGGAVLAPVTLTLLTTTYIEPKARARALGAWAAVAASGGAFGAVIGGILTTELSWRWVLFVNVPIGIALGFAAAASLLESRGLLTKLRELDIPGAVLVTTGLTAIVYAIVSTDLHPWGSAHTIGWGLLGIGLIVAFVFLESRVENPLVPLRIFASERCPPRTSPRWGSARPCSASSSSARSTCRSCSGSARSRPASRSCPRRSRSSSAPRSAPRLVRRVGPRVLLVIGPLISSVGLLWFSHLDAFGSFRHNVLLQGMVVTFGVGLSFVPVTLAGTSGVRRATRAWPPGC